MTRTIAGEQHAYYAEYEFPDVESVQGGASARRSPRAAPDAAGMGYAHSVYFADID